MKKFYAHFDTDLKTAERIDIELLETELITVDNNRISDFIKKRIVMVQKFLLMMLLLSKDYEIKRWG